jgi:hypothetical protein
MSDTESTYPKGKLPGQYVVGPEGRSDELRVPNPPRSADAVARHDNANPMPRTDAAEDGLAEHRRLVERSSRNPNGTLPHTQLENNGPNTALTRGRPGVQVWTDRDGPPLGRR